jgi:hypothetical protein
MSYLGDFPEDFTTVTCMFTTHAATGAPVAPSSGFEAADVIIYKNGSGAQKTSTNGVTMTSPFDSITGLHCVVIDTSNDTGDSGFWVAGAQYTLVLSPDETVDGLAVAKVIGTFTIGRALTAAQVNAEVDTALADYDGPTNTELATALDALPTAVENADEVATRTLLADIRKVNDIAIDGAGTEGNPFGPA